MARLNDIAVGPHAELDLEDAVNDVCPWTGKPVAAEALATYRGRTVGFADRTARDRFFAALVILDAAIEAEEGGHGLATFPAFGRPETHPGMTIH